MRLLAYFDTGALESMHDTLLVRPTPEASSSVEPNEYVAEQRKKAMEYLGDKHILHPESTFKPSKQSILDKWRQERHSV